jgi:hypothetical protein
LEKSHPKIWYYRYEDEVYAIIRTLSPKREAAYRSLVTLLTSTLDGVSVLADLVALYSGPPGLKLPEEVDALNDMVEGIRKQALERAAAHYETLDNPKPARSSGCGPCSLQ